MSSSTDPIEWFRYPFVATDTLAKAWLTTETLLGLAPNTLDAYARGLDDFLGFCQKASISPATATRADLARYVGDLRGRPRSSTQQEPQDHVPTMGLSNATLQQRLTAVRLFFDFLIEEGNAQITLLVEEDTHLASRLELVVSGYWSLVSRPCPGFRAMNNGEPFWLWSNKLRFGRAVWLPWPTMPDCDAKKCALCEATISIQLIAWCVSELR